MGLMRFPRLPRPFNFLRGRYLGIDREYKDEILTYKIHPGPKDFKEEKKYYTEIINLIADDIKNQDDFSVIIEPKEFYKLERSLKELSLKAISQKNHIEEIYNSYERLPLNYIFPISFGAVAGCLTGFLIADRYGQEFSSYITKDINIHIIKYLIEIGLTRIVELTSLTIGTIGGGLFGSKIPFFYNNLKYPLAKKAEKLKKLEEKLLETEDIII